MSANAMTSEYLSIEQLLHLWGKTSKELGYQPELFHMLDVGHVAQCLLAPDGPRRFQTALAHVLGRPPGALQHWLPLVIALHDLGKISSPFQGEVEGQRKRLEQLGFAFPAGSTPVGIRHQHFSAIAVRDHAASSLAPLASVQQLLVDAVAGHHGAFPQPGTIHRAGLFGASREPSEWKALRKESLKQLLRIFPLPGDLRLPPLPNLPAATAALTGFMILCDWLGSDEHRFLAEPGLPLDEYVPISRDRAQVVVKEAGFLDTLPHVTWNGFQSTFRNIKNPRPLQEAIDTLSDADLTSPGLYIIEAPTGEGKTEAALALAHRLVATGGSNGLYVGLPTMATSNQMYGRVRRFLHDNAGTSAAVKLIHGQAFLFEDDLLLQASGDRKDKESAAAAAPVWFAPRKRALLAAHGVGTVDQAELTVLNARHYMLRLFGLAGKVVIIDEVHAYDTYMNTVIDHALWWLAALGTPVILLSATLPTARHRELARAYQRGLVGQPLDRKSDDSQEPLPYPVLAIYPNHGHPPLSPSAAQPERALTIRFVSDQAPAAEARRLLDLVREGGAICRITNTVKRAQKIYAELRKLASHDVELHLLHARLLGDDRLRRELAIAKRVGPESDRTPSDRIIVIGTQLLEQSLDLDFDRVISDLAPTDLLLQRAGRMQRHEHRDRPARFQEPILEVAIGAVEDGLPQLGESQHVYEPFVLWKSWLTLQEREHLTGAVTLTLPADYRVMIEATYDERWDILPQDHSGRSRLRDAWKRWRRKREDMAQSARERVIPEPNPATAITEGAPIVFEEDEDGGKQGWGFAATRYGEESITVIPLNRVPGGIAVEPNEEPLPAGSLDREPQLRLLRRGIRVSNRDLVELLPQSGHVELPWWDDAPLLRYHHPLILVDGAQVIGSTKVRLDPELGLIFGEEDK